MSIGFLYDHFQQITSHELAKCGFQHERTSFNRKNWSQSKTLRFFVFSRFFLERTFGSSWAVNRAISLKLFGQIPALARPEGDLGSLFCL